MIAVRPHQIQYIPRNMHTVFALLCFVVVIHWLISQYPSGLLHWHWGNSASKATLMNMDKYFMWIHYERLRNHNKAKHNKTVCIFLGIYCIMRTISLDWQGIWMPLWWSAYVLLLSQLPYTCILICQYVNFFACYICYRLCRGYACITPKVYKHDGLHQLIEAEWRIYASVN